MVNKHGISFIPVQNPYTKYKVMAPKNFIEVSFEVANKVGGIYQVLKSKNQYMQQKYGENYLTIGYYNEEQAAEDFAPREENPFEEIFEELAQNHGIKCRYGVWKVPGEPKTILIDPKNLEKPVDEIKKYLWEKHGIDSLNTGSEFDDPIKWSYSVGKLLEKIENKKDQEIVVQLHEWLSGSAQFYNDLPTVFTTHATVSGRALSNSNHNLKGMIEKNQEITNEKIEELGIKAKHQIEKESAHEAEVFTTVSQSTGKEAELLLDKKPDIILPNGLNLDEFPTLGELSHQHKKEKQKMLRFLRAYFKPYYNVDLENDPRIIFTSGRYEYRNKGLDIFIEALSKINKEEGEDLYVFIFVPSDTKREKSEVIENLSLYTELEDYIEKKIGELEDEMLNSITSSRSILQDLSESINKDRKEIENLQKNFRTKNKDKPPLTAYELNYSDDEILNKLREEGLTNSEDDRVKVVFYPKYLSVGDKMLSMNYEDAVKATTAGIFPSYYEPWGYTPVETAASGALSITTDLAGFGQYLKDKTDSRERKGIRIIERENVSDKESVDQLAEIIENISNYTKTEITERKHNARKLAQLTSWQKLGEKYIQAHKKAVDQK